MFRAWHAMRHRLLSRPRRRAAGGPPGPPPAAGTNARRRIDAVASAMLVTVRSGEDQAERCAFAMDLEPMAAHGSPICGDVALRPRLAPVRRVRPRRRTPFWPRSRRCRSRRATSRASRLVQSFQKHPVQLAPHPGSLPVPHPAPARHSGAAERLPGQHLPGNAGP